MKQDFEIYPRYRLNYVRAFDRMLINLTNRDLESHAGWRTGEDVMRWWVGDDPRWHENPKKSGG